MSHYPNAQFLKSANARSQFVPDTGIEVAVAGRSNAGKSSAINVIVNRRQFARTSKTPGRTQLVNCHWGELLAEYFESRQSLAGLILIVDIRRRLTDFDRRMIEFAESVDLPIHILLTKADKLKKGQAAAAVLEVRKELGDRATVQQFSALKRQGEQEAREVLERFLAAGA
jgi:GTP-binding protein